MHTSEITSMELQMLILILLVQLCKPQQLLGMSLNNVILPFVFMSEFSRSVNYLGLSERNKERNHKKNCLAICSYTLFWLKLHSCFLICRET